MRRVKRFRTGFRVAPTHLPCGCRIKNKQGAGITQNAVLLNDGTRICKHGKRWGFVIKAKLFEEIGLYPELDGVKLRPIPASDRERPEPSTAGALLMAAEEIDKIPPAERERIGRALRIAASIRDPKFRD